MSNESKIAEWFPIEGIGYGPIEIGEYGAEFKPFPRCTVFGVNPTPVWVVTWRGEVIGTAESPSQVRKVIQWAEAHPRAA